MSRRIDTAEALANAGLGLIVSWLLCWLWLGFTPGGSVVVTGVFFCASTSRAYVLRRVFRRLHG